MALGGLDAVERDRVAGIVGFRRHRCKRPTLVERRDQRRGQAADGGEPSLFERRSERRVAARLGVIDDPRREPVLPAGNQIAQSAQLRRAFLRIVRGLERHRLASESAARRLDRQAVRFGLVVRRALDGRRRIRASDCVLVSPTAAGRREAARRPPRSRSPSKSDAGRRATTRRKALDPGGRKGPLRPAARRCG